MEKPQIIWRDTPQGQLPVSAQFDDPYYAIEDGLAETQHVFLKGNGLPEGFFDGMTIAELGFGTGLNLCATLQAWGAHAGHFSFVSFEKYPMPAKEMAQALSAWPQIAPVAEILCSALRWNEPFRVGAAEVTLVKGDARETLARWQGSADVWYLDGFSPAKNPELWEETLLKEVARHTRPGGRASTYSAAGHVRRGLTTAGFEVTKQPGFGRKRDMTVARLPEKITAT